MKQPTKQLKSLTNRQIKASIIRIIYGEINKTVSIYEALQMAADAGLDLVQMNSEQIPTCRIMDYSRHLFEEKKKKKMQNAHKVDIKEIQIKPSISINDLSIKKKQIDLFLAEGMEVRLKLKLKGREKANADKNGLFLIQFAKGFEECAKIEAKLLSSGAPVGGLVTLKGIKQKDSKDIK